MLALKPFEFREPETVEKAVQILSIHGEKAKVLAGGVDLVPRMRQRKILPEFVVSIQRISALDYIEGSKAGLRIGALTKLRSIELSPLVQRDYAIISEAIQTIASVHVKNMGTAVGNLCVATPASDVAPPLSVLGAKLRVVGADAEKVIPIESLFTGGNQTILRPDEIITEILVPARPAKAGSTFLKLARTAVDIAKVNVAVTVTVTNNTCQEANIALGSVGPTLIRAKKAEETLRGKKLEQDIIETAAQVAAEEAEPITDVRSTAAYRKEMTRVLVMRAMEKALERAKV